MPGQYLASLQHGGERGAGSRQDVAGPDYVDSGHGVALRSQRGEGRGQRRFALPGVEHHDMNRWPAG